MNLFKIIKMAVYLIKTGSNGKLISELPFRLAWNYTEKGVRWLSKVEILAEFQIGNKTLEEVRSQGLEPTPKNYGAGKLLRVPKFGMHDRRETLEVHGETRKRAYGCVLAKLWKEYGEEKIGRLYCYVDPAKYMAFNPNYKLVHTKAVPDGDECCELVVRPTTEKERKDFSAKNRDWRYIDK